MMDFIYAWQDSLQHRKVFGKEYIFESDPFSPLSPECLQGSNPTLKQLALLLPSLGLHFYVKRKYILWFTVSKYSSNIFPF